MAGVNGLALSAVAAGSLFAYAGISGKSILGTLGALIKGQPPGQAATLNPITAPSDGGTDEELPGRPLAGTSPSGTLSQSQIEQLWQANGGAAGTAAFAARVAMSESSGRTAVTSSNRDGGTNVGLWQLDTKGVGSGYTVAELQEANLNAQITIMATDNGQDWQEWGDPVTASVGYHYTPGG
ncbi:MAG TPA: hypothetical protein VGG75_05680 [Trebonia sp.]|jgi:hypothetical protein